MIMHHHKTLTLTTVDRSRDSYSSVVGFRVEKKKIALHFPRIVRSHSFQHIWIFRVCARELIWDEHFHNLANISPYAIETI